MLITEKTIKEQLKAAVLQIDSKKQKGITNEMVDDFLSRMHISFDEPKYESIENDKLISEDINEVLCAVSDHDAMTEYMKTMAEIVEVRPEELVCDVVRFQNNKEKWVALVGLLNGRPYEIFTGLQDEDDGIILPKTVTSGKIIKRVKSDGTKRYDFQFENRRGYKTTVEGLSEKFNPEYWNYAKLISGVLRYRMPIENVLKLVSSMQMKTESINTWKNGVERALKKYINDNSDTNTGE